jgi:hypothetical protein
MGPKDQLEDQKINRLFLTIEWSKQEERPQTDKSRAQGNEWRGRVPQSTCAWVAQRQQSGTFF